MMAISRGMGLEESAFRLALLQRVRARCSSPMSAVEACSRAPTNSSSGKSSTSAAPALIRSSDRRYSSISRWKCFRFNPCSATPCRALSAPGQIAGEHPRGDLLKGQARRYAKQLPQVGRFDAGAERDDELLQQVLGVPEAPLRGPDDGLHYPGLDLYALVLAEFLEPALDGALAETPEVEALASGYDGDGSR